MEKSGPNRYRVVATYKQNRVGFTVTASTSRKAVAEARSISKAQGMSRIQVNYVKKLDDFVIVYHPFFDAPLTMLGGVCQDVDKEITYAERTSSDVVPTFSLAELNAKIENVWNHLVSFTPRPDRPPLRAYKLNGRIFVDDGFSGRQELYNRSPFELAMLLYDWVTYAGYYSDDFEQFVKESWLPK